MNKKTVAKALIRKHKDFLESIEDTEIRSLIEKNSIITGGAIVSLLTNEPVSDYDYYFTDKDTCKKIAEYFVSKFVESHPESSMTVEVPEDSDRVKISIPSEGIETESEELSDTLTPGEAVGTADDINSEYLDNMDEGKEKYRPVFFSANAITLSDKVQLITRFYGSPEEIHKNYDFTHCTNYWLSKDGKLTLNQPALESILSKTLYYQGSLYPVCSVIRTRKFIKRGWHINAGQYLKMMFQISELNLFDISILEDQLTGVDSAYFHQVIEYCKKRQEEDSSFKINAPYLISIIDKIF